MLTDLFARILVAPGQAATDSLHQDQPPNSAPARARPPTDPLTREPMWSRPALLAATLLAAGLYLWNLSSNGWANEYYAAAVLSMTQSWSNFFFGSFDPGGFITVDKPPFAFWIQAISARIFGLSSWSILVPQALAGIVTLLVVHHLVRRAFGHLAAIIAALTLALTPITVAVNRDNLPDSVLVLLMVLAAWAVLNAISSARLRPLLLGAALVGLAFNAKMLQAYIVVPAFALSYLLAAPVSLPRRLVHLVAAGLVLLIVSASWMVAVDAIPAEARPYVGGSSNNTVLDLVVGYNGLSRIFGNFGPPGPGAPDGTPPGMNAPGGNPPGLNAPGGVGPGQGPQNGGPGNGGPGFGGAMFGGPSGWLRLFNGESAAQISWLLPLAALATVGGLVARGRVGRTDPTRAFFVLWGGWLATHFVVFSLARGIFHPYYTTAMAPAVAALGGAGLAIFWDRYRRGGWPALALPTVLGLAVVWPLVLLTWIPWGEPWLRLGVVVCAGLAIVALLSGLVAQRFGWRWLPSLAAPAMTLGVLAILLAPGVWSVTTLQGGQNGVMPAAGPMGAFVGSGPGGRAPVGQPPGANPAAVAGDGARGFRGGRPPTVPPPSGAAPTGDDLAPTASAGAQPPASYGTAPPDLEGNPVPGFGSPPGAPPFNTGGASGGPAFGPGRGPGGRGIVSEQLTQYLVANQGSARFLVATGSSMSAAPMILATGKPVMAMGGFGGGDPALSLERLQAMVRSGELRFLLLDANPGGPAGFGGPGGFGRGGSERNDWVRASCSVVDPATYGGTTTSDGELYDCARAAAAGA